jgi:hypothetical protein
MAEAGSTTHVDAGTAEASSNAGASETAALQSVLDGSPNAAATSAGAALQAALTASQISYLENIDWSKETSATFLNDAVVMASVRALHGVAIQHGH